METRLFDRLHIFGERSGNLVDGAQFYVKDILASLEAANQQELFTGLYTRLEQHPGLLWSYLCKCNVALGVLLGVGG